MGTGDDREILQRMRDHLARTRRAASLLANVRDGPEIERARADIAVALVYLERAIATMEAAIAQEDAESDGEHQVG